MLFQNRLKARLYFRAGTTSLSVRRGEVANDLLDETIVGIGFDHLHQLQRRLFKFDALRRDSYSAPSIIWAQ